MKVTKDIEEAKRLLDEARAEMEDQDTKIQALPDDVAEEERTFHENLFQQRAADVERRREALERLVALRKAYELVPLEKDEEDRDTDKVYPEARGSRKEPNTYRRGGPYSFFTDLFKAEIGGDPEARIRLAQHAKEIEYEQRSMSTTVTAGGNFIPPTYLGSMYAELARPGRPFADVVPSSPLMGTGMSITIPRITTGTLVAVQSTQNTSLGTQDVVEALLTVPVVTIGGYADLSVQLAERSDPDFDQILFNDLRSDYDRVLDYQLINGTGTNSQHVGIRTVSNINTVSYTSATPTAAGLVPKIYDAIQKVSTVRYQDPDTILGHPRRTAWLASNLSSTFPLFQLGALNQAAGVQAGGFTSNIAGLRVVNDANIQSLLGASTTEDEMFVVKVSDMHLWEGPLRAEVFRDVGSATGTVRVRLYAYSAFASGRFPGSITKISGTGLIAPTF